VPVNGLAWALQIKTPAKLTAPAMNKTTTIFIIASLAPSPFVSAIGRNYSLVLAT